MKHKLQAAKQKEELYDTELIAIVNADEGIKKQEMLLVIVNLC